MERRGLVADEQSALHRRGGLVYHRDAGKRRRHPHRRGWPAWSGMDDDKVVFGKLDKPGRWAGWLYATDAESGKVA